MIDFSKSSSLLKLPGTWKRQLYTDLTIIWPRRTVWEANNAPSLCTHRILKATHSHKIESWSFRSKFKQLTGLDSSVDKVLLLDISDSVDMKLQETSSAVPPEFDIFPLSTVACNPKCSINLLMNWRHCTSVTIWHNFELSVPISSIWPLWSPILTFTTNDSSRRSTCLRLFAFDISQQAKFVTMPTFCATNLYTKTLLLQNSLFFNSSQQLLSQTRQLVLHKRYLMLQSVHSQSHGKKLQSETDYLLFVEEVRHAVACFFWVTWLSLSIADRAASCWP